jgi:hypothetical protein
MDGVHLARPSGEDHVSGRAMTTLRAVLAKLRLWFDTAATPAGGNPAEHRVDWVRVLPFVAMHLACLGVIWVGASWTAVAELWAVNTS